MDIQLVWGYGSGKTPLGSFDDALSDANIHNYNLVELSSVIPADADVVTAGSLEPGRWDVGDPVAVVLAKNTSTVADSTIAAGLGWQQAAQGGVFMENEADSAEACRRRLENNLQDAESVRDWEWDPEHHTKVVEQTIDDVGTVIVAAVYGPLDYKER